METVRRPVASQIFNHPRLRKVLRLRGHHSVNTYLGPYGAPTWKPVKLVSDDPCVEKLWRTNVVVLYDAHV